MIKIFFKLLGSDAAVFRRYGFMAIGYGLLSGLTITALVPVLLNLLTGNLGGAALWLAILLAAVIASWAWRLQVEKASVQLRLAVLGPARERLGDHIATLPIGWFTPQNTSRLNNILSHGMFELSELPGHLFTPIISGVVTPLVYVIALFLIYWPMGMITLFALPILVLVFLLSAYLGQRADAIFHKKSAQTSQRIVEFAQSQSVLRAFNGGSSSMRFLERAIDEQGKSGKKLILASTASVILNFWFIQLVFAALFMTSIIWLNSLSEASFNTETIAAIIVSLLLVQRFIDPLIEVAGYGEALRSARGQLDAVNDILSVEPLPLAQNPQTPKDGSVVLKDVHFAYATNQPEILQGISLDIPTGSMTALVGASGSGKSTIIRLIARFFDVSRGQILVGGIDIRNLTTTQMANQISQIFQDTYLFQGSIADNIRIGKPMASDNEIMAVAQQAGVIDIIKRLPQGFDTSVGEGGVRLSGGERQRISIARALLKDAPILLVDEATAALDGENQAAIAETLARLRGKRTLIVIAHQLSTIAMADQIIVLDKGVICEQGTAENLKAKQGLYAHFLAQRQRAKGWRIS